MKYLATIIAFIALWGSPSLSEILSCRKLLKLNGLDTTSSAAEFETDINNLWIDFFDTRDGFLGSLSPYIQITTYDDPFYKWAAKNHPGVPLKKIRWLQIPRRFRFRFLSEAHGSKLKDFMKGGRHRRIRGLVVRSQVPITFRQATNLFGKHFESGNYLFKPKGFLQDYVEYQSPQDFLGPVSGVELHFRAELRSRRLASEVDNFLTAVTGEKQPFHMHTPQFLPIADLLRHGTINKGAWVITEFARRASLLAEFLSVLDGYDISKVGDANASLFSSPDFAGFRDLYHYLFDIGSMANDWYNSHKDLQDTLDNFIKAIIAIHEKMLEKYPFDDFDRRILFGHIAVQGHTTYDRKMTWGIETRNKFRKTSMPNFYAYLNYLDEALFDHEWRIDVNALTAWHEKLGNDYWTGFSEQQNFPFFRAKVRDIAHSWYRWRLPENAEAHSFLSQAARSVMTPELWEKLRLITKDRFQVYWLFHDWGLDPVTFSHADVLQKIGEAQIWALKRLQRGASVSWIMPRFLLRSGLLAAFAENAGFKPVLNPTHADYLKRFEAYHQGLSSSVGTQLELNYAQEPPLQNASGF